MGSKDLEKTRAELIAELDELRRKLSRLSGTPEDASPPGGRPGEAEEFPRELIDNIPVGLFRNTPGPTGKFIMANPAIARMFGYERLEDFLRGSVVDCYQDPEERKRFSDNLLAAGEVTDRELRLKRRDGSTLWGSVSARLVRDRSGQIQCFDGIIEDISARKAVEEALLRSERRYREFFEGLRDGLAAVDLAGRIVETNQKFQTMLGYSDQELADLTYEDLTPARWHQVEGRILEQQVLTRGYSDLYEKEYRRKDGSVFPVELSTYLIRDDAGAPAGMWATVRDIGERKAVERELRESEERFRALFERSRDALMILDRDGFIDGNTAALALFGCATREEFISRHPSELSPARQPDGTDSLSASRDRIEAAFAEGSQFFEWVHTRRDGAPFHANVLLSRFELRGQTVLQATVRDITESKRFEDERKESRRRLESIINFLPDATFVIDAGGRVTAWNRAIAAMTGIEAEAMLGRGDFEYALPFYGERRPILIDLARKPLEQVRQNYQNVRREGEALFGEGFAPKLRGGGVWFQGSAAPLRDAAGRVVGAIETFHDVTGSKRVLEELRDSQRRLADIIAFLPDPTMVIDAEGRVTAWNRALEEMTGVKAENVLGKGDYEHALPFYGERRPILIDLVLRPKEEVEAKYAHLHRQGDVLTGQGHITNLGGGDLFFVGSAIPLRDSAGKVVGAIEAIRDVTERKRFEDELARAKDAAEAANRSKSAFLAMMSHEIRTPMNAIIGMAEILADTELSDEQRASAEVIMSSAGALLNIINDILDFSKIEAGRMDLTARPFDLRQLVEELGQLFALRVDQRKIDLVINYEPGAPENFVGDEVRLRQVLTNLLGNAAKFTREGYILLEVACPKRDARSATLEFRVEDTGIGIPPEAQEIIFDKFTQVDSSPRRRFEGTGLGLAITRQLLNLMGGQIELESEVDKGSNFHFTVTLPLADEVKEGPKPSADLSGLRTLVVDDNKINRVVALKQLASWEMAADDAATPAEALEKLQRAARSGQPYDLALLDFQMPEMDGIQLAEKIKQDPELQGVVLIMLFSVMHHSDLDHLQRLGVAACLTKPLRARLLLETISTVWAARLDRRSIGMITLHRPSFEEYRRRAAGEGPRFSSARVLLAEDNPTNQKVAVKLLETLGCQVEVASDGAEAVKMAQAQPFDLIFMDCQMPNLDGFEATRRLREHEQGRHTTIVAMTAYAMQGDRDRCLDAGMDDYLSKPISRRRVREILERYLVPDGERAPERVEKALIADPDAKAMSLAAQAVRKALPGVKIKTCADGVRLAALLNSFHPDLVAIDLDVPDVNVAAVIRYLRQEERFAQTRVIVTRDPAGAGPERLAEITALGVDAILDKPLSLERLEAAVTRAAKSAPADAPSERRDPGAGTVPPTAVPRPEPPPAAPAAPDAPDAPDAPPAAPETLPTLDREALNNITDGDAELALEILGFYRDSLPAGVQKIFAALEAGDVTAIERNAHGIKGAAANIGATRLSKLAGRIEIEARAGKMEECRALAPGLNPTLTELLQEIEKLIGEAGPASA